MVSILVVSLLFLGVALAATTDRLMKVQVVYRHGDSTPLDSYVNDPNKNVLFAEADAGELTNAGKQHQLEFGQWLRQRYSNLLPEKYSYQDIKIISDDMDVCLMSAASNLAGLYPPKGDQIWNPLIKWQPIPIHTNESILGSLRNNCPTNDLLKETILNNMFYQTITEVSQPLFNLVAKNTGETVTSIEQTYNIRDILYTEEALGLDLPKWTSTIYPDALTVLSELLLSVFTYNDDIAKLNTGPLLRTIVDEFETATEKMIMYSAHDFNVANLVNYLSTLYGGIVPEFTSSVIFELWEQKSGVQYLNMYVKRNDKLELLEIKNCGKSCEIGKFKSVFKNVMITLSERDKLC